MQPLDNKHQGSPSSPSSKRFPFRPASKIMPKGNHDFLSRDPFAESSSQSRPIHVMTPAKSKLTGFFGGGGNNATPSTARRRTSMTGSAASGTTDLASKHMPLPPVPKVRASMVPESRIRPTPIPTLAPRSVLSSSTSHQNDTIGERPTTMRLVRGSQDCVDDETGPLPLPMLDPVGGYRDQCYSDSVMENDVYQLEAGLADVSLDEWNASRAQDETVLVTIR
jgi:hypothetical protein